MSKLFPVQLLPGDSIASVMDKCHEVFKETIANKDRPPLSGKKIFLPLSWVEGKAEIFWHIASISEMPQLDIKPCVNDRASMICEANCIFANDSIFLPSSLEWREKCIYRAVRVKWIREIIDLYNKNDLRITYWEKENSKKKTRIYLRYQEEEIDYVVVFERKSESKVTLITAFPVFFLGEKKSLTKEYNDYLRTI